MKALQVKIIKVLKNKNGTVFIAIGLGVLIKRSDTLFIVGIIWGLSGLVFDGTMKIINTGSKTKKLLTQSI